MRPLTLLLAAGLALTSLPSLAQAPAPGARHTHKAPKARTVAPAPSGSGGINTPSTDFSTVERADDGDAGPSSGGSMKPMLTPSGNIGLGAGF